MPGACRPFRLCVFTRLNHRARTLPQDIVTCMSAYGMVTDLNFLTFTVILCSQHCTIVFICYPTHFTNRSCLYPVKPTQKNKRKLKTHKNRDMKTPCATRTSCAVFHLDQKELDSSAAGKKSSSASRLLSSSVTKGLSQGVKLAESGPLVTVGGPLANTQK